MIFIEKQLILELDGDELKVQVLRIVLILITLGCILGPIGTVVVMYRNNLSGMVVTSQLRQYFSNNNNSNNNGNNNSNNNGNNSPNNNGNNNNISNGNENNYNNNGNGGNIVSNSGGVTNNNPQVNSPTNTFGSSGQFDVTAQNSQAPVSDQIMANVNCLVAENGNNIQLSLDMSPQNVPNDLQSIFSTSNDYVFNFAGTTTTSSSGMQITASAQGNLNPGGSFSINLAGSLDQNQDTLTFTLTSAGNSQATITTPQSIIAHPNGTNNGNSNNNNSNNNNSNNNGNSNSRPSYAGGTINTSEKTISLTFSVINSNSQSETLNSMGGTIETTTGQYKLGTVSLDKAPVTIPSGQTVTITLSGSLTSSGQSDLANNFSGASSIDVTAINAAMTLNGVSQSQSGPQEIGTVNITS